MDNFFFFFEFQVSTNIGYMQNACPNQNTPTQVPLFKLPYKWHNIDTWERIELIPLYPWELMKKQMHYAIIYKPKDVLIAPTSTLWTAHYFN